MGAEEPITKWQVTRLGDLGEVKMGRQAAPKYRMGKGVRPYLRVVNVSEGRLDLRDVKQMDFTDADFERYRLLPGDVLLTEGDLVSAANVGRSAVFRGEIPECCFQNTLLRFRSGPTLDPQFAHYAFCHLRSKRKFAPLANGTTVFHLGCDRLKDLLVPTPPLAEQHRIAAILASVDATIESTEAVIAKVEVVTKALMTELLMRGMPGRHKELRTTEFGNTPSSWSTATYGELAAAVPGAIQSGPFGSALKHSEFVPTGHLVVGIDNVLDGQFSIGANHRITAEKFAGLRKFVARPRDLLITVMATVGRCCVVPDDIGEAIITKHVYRLTVDQSRAIPKFLMYCLYRLPRLANEVRGSAQGLTRLGLNKSLLLPLRFPLPPLAEQEEIIRVFEQQRDRIDVETRCLEVQKTLKAGLLETLLSGRQRAPIAEAAA